MKKMILIIGDPDDAVENAIDELKGNYTIQTASDVALAENLIRILNPSLILALPEWINMDTVENYKQMIDTFPEIPFALLGTEEDKHSAEMCFRKQMENVLLPFESAKAIAKISELLGERKAGGGGSFGVGKTVLIIDDNPNTLRSMKSILDSKYRVLLAPSGDKGLQMMASNLPAVVLLDYEMPGMDGKEVFSRSRQDVLLAQIPVIFLTAVNDKAKIMDILSLHPAGYLLKPSTPDKLFDAIEKATGG